MISDKQSEKPTCELESCANVVDVARRRKDGSPIYRRYCWRHRRPRTRIDDTEVHEFTLRWPCSPIPIEGETKAQNAARLGEISPYWVAYINKKTLKKN